MYRKNLDAAFLGAATTPSGSNVLVTATEQPWEQVANVVQVKSGFGSNGCKVGTDSTTATPDVSAGTVNVSSNITWSGTYWSLAVSPQYISEYSPATSNSSPFSFSGGGSDAANVWKAFANDDNTGFLFPNALPYYAQIDFGSTKTITSYKLLGHPSDGSYSPKDWTLLGSNTGSFSGEETTVDSRSGQTIGTTYSLLYTCSSPGAFRYYRFNITAALSQAISPLSELKLYELSHVTTPNLVTGTMSFSPSELKLYTTSAMGTELNSGEATVSFKKIIGAVTTDYGSQESLATFRARPASEFANCTSLWFRVAPVGTYTFGALTIPTTSSSVITTKSGSVTISVNSQTVYEVQTDGDLTAADITADDISLTGSVDQDREATTVKSQTKSDNYTMTDADSGYVTYVDTDAKTMTLPATAVNRVFTFMNAGADGAVALTISPNASDKIMGVGLTAADDKDLVNTKATAKKGDYVTLVGDGVDGWFVTAMKGTWARQA